MLAFDIPSQQLGEAASALRRVVRLGAFHSMSDLHN
jgi:hypothetical protein